jgi:acyl-coenzyme A thioesterase PaaI-like protein
MIAAQIAATLPQQGGPKRENREVDYEAVRAGLAAAIPFNTHIGLRIESVADGEGVVTLPDEAHLRNHVGSQHAGALFTAAEAASGGAVVGAFAEQMGSVVPLAASAEIRYRKIASGPITAKARLGADKEAILKELDANGKAQFPVEVALTNGEGTTVAEMTVHWHLRKL